MSRYDTPNEYQEARQSVSLVERNAKPSGVQLVSSHRVGQHDAQDIVALANEIKTADAAIRNNATGKLGLIVDQIRFLQSQAQKILEETKENEQLHHVACNFKKVVGQVYHLYKRESGQKYFSMLSREEFGPSCPHEYLGSYRLEADQSWTPADKLEAVQRNQVLVRKILDTSNDGNANFFGIADE